jgi:hypothetical protein
MIAPAFTDEQWFMQHCSLRFHNAYPTRAKKVPIEQNDAYYIDSWAKETWSRAYGEFSFNRWNGKRILACDENGDGVDILDFLHAIANRCSE